jgi:hypothetical protein
MSSHRGNSRSHLVRKLKKEGRPDLVRAVEAGAVTPFAAACEMGWRKRARTLGTGSSNAAKRRAARLRKFGVDGRLTGDQIQELWLGPPAGGSAFAGDEERRVAWFRQRDFLMTSGGRRPMAWWHYEAGDLSYPGYDLERSTLFAAGLLGAEEAAELLAEWRDDFDRAHRPGFFHCKGPGRCLRGAAARRAHYAWADIPRELLIEWTLARRRSARAVRGMRPAA